MKIGNLIMRRSTAVCIGTLTSAVLLVALSGCSSTSYSEGVLNEALLTPTDVESTSFSEPVQYIEPTFSTLQEAANISFVDSWADGGGYPESCVFAAANTPLSGFETDSDPSWGSKVMTSSVLVFEDGLYLYMSARLFNTSKDAETFLDSVDSVLATCDGYTLWTEATTVSAQDAAPFSSGLSWTTERTNGATTVFLTSNANLVVKLEYRTDSDSEASFTEDQIEELAKAEDAKLKDLASQYD